MDSSKIKKILPKLQKIRPMKYTKSKTQIGFGFISYEEETISPIIEESRSSRLSISGSWASIVGVAIAIWKAFTDWWPF